MKIIGTNTNFILLDVLHEKQINGLSLILTNISYFPRELNPSDYKKFKLTITGIENLDVVKKELSEFILHYIDVERTENENLIFWSEDHKIGEYQSENFSEEIFDLEKEDWIENYRHLLNEYYKQSDIITKESLLHTKFFERIDNFINEERKKAGKKSEFFKNDSAKVNAQNEKMTLIDRLENIKDQYLGEYRNLE